MFNIFVHKFFEKLLINTNSNMLDEVLASSESIEIKEKRALYKPSSKKVYCTLTNKEWSSIKECWEELYSNKFSLGHLRSMN